MEKYINTPIDDKIVSELKAGDYVYLTGTVYTARDAAHKRLYEALQRGEDIPLELQNNIIYYLLINIILSNDLLKGGTIKYDRY